MFDKTIYLEKAHFRSDFYPADSSHTFLETYLVLKHNHNPCANFFKRGKKKWTNLEIEIHLRETYWNSEF